MHEETQPLVIGQISNFAQYTLDSITTSFSVTFASSCGGRVAHLVGWKAEGSALEKHLHAWREAGDDKDNGMPIALKESSHIYKTVMSVPRAETQTLFALGKGNDVFPLFSLDIFNCFHPSSQEEVLSLVKFAAKEAANSLPQLNAMHVLQSTDKLTVALIGAWSSLEGRSSLDSVPGYVEAMKKVQGLSNAGTFTDLLDKKKNEGRNSSNRTYLVASTHLP